jgi:chromosome segregation ATPase
MNDKSISELARELGVSRQAIYKRLKTDNQLSTSLQKFTVNRNNKTLYSLQGQELIKKAFEGSAVNQSCQPVDSGLQSTSCQVDTSLQDKVDSIQADLDRALAQKDALQAQLADKDKLADELRGNNERLQAQLDSILADKADLIADKHYLQDLVNKLTEQNERLTTALQAAQALHGIDKQVKPIEVKPVEPHHQEPRPHDTKNRANNQGTHVIQKELRRRQKPPKNREKQSFLQTVKKLFQHD